MKNIKMEHIKWEMWHKQKNVLNMYIKHAESE